jgi:hypothetical protein
LTITPLEAVRSAVARLEKSVSLTENGFERSALKTIANSNYPV